MARSCSSMGRALNSLTYSLGDQGFESALEVRHLRIRHKKFLVTQQGGMWANIPLLAGSNSLNYSP